MQCGHQEIVIGRRDVRRVGDERRRRRRQRSRALEETAVVHLRANQCHHGISIWAWGVSGWRAMSPASRQVPQACCQLTMSSINPDMLRCDTAFIAGCSRCRCSPGSYCAVALLARRDAPTRSPLHSVQTCTIAPKNVILRIELISHEQKRTDPPYSIAHPLMTPLNRHLTSAFSTGEPSPLPNSMMESKS